MLKQYITQTGASRREFAAKLGISTGFLSLLESGKRMPSLTLATKIERETGGVVPASGWVELPETDRGVA